MQTMKPELFHGILDAIDIASSYFQTKIKLRVGCAIETDEPNERHQYIREAQQFKAWQQELVDLKKEFTDTYTPIKE